MIVELLGQAEEVFERLLELAAQRPGKYIIDCPKRLTGECLGS
jgi:hypothetical protein